ncbi:MAG: hypothetical protein HRU77_00950 [Gammaproteobacteria bacterium]|nr:MAG: hypothetical protein HRU77_00950 [Gammaproteobacteria bacterium]
MKESTTFHAGCKILASALVCISSWFSASAFANVFDYNNSGIVKASSGNYYLVEGKNVTQISPKKAMSLQYKFPVNTTRGAQEVAFVRQATPYIPKIGAAVTTMAKRLGPAGMAISACDLTNICNQAGQWLTMTPDLPDGNTQWTCYGSTVLTLSVCRNDHTLGYACADANVQCTDDKLGPDGKTYTFKRAINNGPQSLITLSRGTPVSVTSTGSPTQDSDWALAESKLNDSRFVDELVSKNEQVPINLPAMTNSPMRQLVSDVYDPQFNSSGTQTGTKRTLTELVIEDAATTDKPNQINVKEEATTTYYDNTGNVVGTITKSTTEVTQQTPQPAQHARSRALQRSD